MTYPLFTVIIPQKNRAEYLYHTLRTCMIQDYPNFEIIVSDDCSDDNSVEIVKELANKDVRIKLFAHKQHLGMRDNFEFALNQVCDGYVIALGGDDGLLPGAIWKMYEIIKKTGRELLTWRVASFQYAENNEQGHSIYWTKRCKFEEIKIVKSSDFLQRIANTFIYLVDECPMFYIKGVASTELIKRVKSRTPDHNFYYCPTPDGFSGVVLAGEVPDFVFTNQPLSIGGSTKHSQGMNYRRTDKESRAEAEQFFKDSVRRTMHKELASQPYSPLIPLMTADYLLTAADLPGWPGKCYEVSYENLIKKTFKYIENSYFENEVLIRELNILENIAKQHNLSDLYDKLYKKTKRKVPQKNIVYGTLISNSLRLDGKEFGIDNIFDAAIVTNFIFRSIIGLSMKSLWRVFVNSISNILNTRIYKRMNLPERIVENI